MPIGELPTEGEAPVLGEAEYVEPLVVHELRSALLCEVRLDVPQVLRREGAPHFGVIAASSVAGFHGISAAPPKSPGVVGAPARRPILDGGNRRRRRTPRRLSERPPSRFPRRARVPALSLAPSRTSGRSRAHSASVS